MSIQQLLDEIPYDILKNTFENANKNEKFWTDNSIDNIYIAYLANYAYYYGENKDAGFSDYTLKIRSKINNCKKDFSYRGLFEHIKNKSIEEIIEIDYKVQNNELTWLEGIKKLFTLEDLGIYGW